MKIAHIAHSFFPIIGGAEIAVHNIIDTLYERGHKVTLYVSFIFFIKNFRKFHYKIRPLPVYNSMSSFNGNKFAYWLVTNYLKIMQKFFKYDIWHSTYTFPTGYHLSALKNIVPIFLTSQGADIQKIPELGYGFRLNPKIEKLISATVKKFDGLAAISNSVKKEFLHLGVKRDVIFEIPNGVDTSRFKSQIDKIELRKKYGLPVNKKIILTTGRNHPKKGFNAINDIVEELIMINKDFVWIIVGKGNRDLVKSFDSTAKEFVIGINEIGYQDSSKNKDNMYQFPSQELIDFYLLSDVYGFPSKVEALPLVLTEALAASIPIVTTNVAGCKDAIKNEVEGFIVEYGQWREFARKVDLLLCNENTYKKFSLNALNSSKKYDWDRVIDLYLGAYKKIIAERKY